MCNGLSHAMTGKDLWKMRQEIDMALEELEENEPTFRDRGGE